MTTPLSKTLLAGVLAGVLIYAIGFATFASSLYDAFYASAPPARIAAVQDVIARELAPTGNGVYDIPNPKDDATRDRLARGPVATVFFENNGLSRPAANSVIGGILICLATGLGLAFVNRQLFGLARRARASAMLSLITVLLVYRDLGQPIFNAFGWTFFIASFVQDLVALGGAALLAIAIDRPRDAPSSGRDRAAAAI